METRESKGTLQLEPLVPTDYSISSLSFNNLPLPLGLGLKLIFSSIRVVVWIEKKYVWSIPKKKIDQILSETIFKLIQ